MAEAVAPKKHRRVSLAGIIQLGPSLGWCASVATPFFGQPKTIRSKLPVDEFSSKFNSKFAFASFQTLRCKLPAL